MLRALAVLLIILLLMLQYTLWFGDGGYGDMRGLERQVAAQAAENKRLATRNQALGAEVEDLKQGTGAIEGRAREELGLIKPGEMFYQVIGPAPAASIRAHER